MMKYNSSELFGWNNNIIADVGEVVSVRCEGVVWTRSGVYTQIGPGWAQTSEMLLSLLSPPVTGLSVSGQFLSWNRINHSSQTEQRRKPSQDCAI